MATKSDLIDFADLTGADREAWGALQASDPFLWSPYFSYSYAAAANIARPGVKVLKFSEGSTPVAYWPVRPGPLGTARPVGGPMDDLHGIVAAPGTALDPVRDQSPGMLAAMHLLRRPTPSTATA